MSPMSEEATTEEERLAARLVDVIAGEGPFGPRWEWWFAVGGTEEARKLRTWTSRNLHPGSRTGAFARALLGRNENSGERVDPAALVGRECILVVERNPKGFLVVKDVMAASGGIRT